MTPLHPILPIPTPPSPPVPTPLTHFLCATRRSGGHGEDSAWRVRCERLWRKVCQQPLCWRPDEACPGSLPGCPQLLACPTYHCAHRKDGPALVPGETLEKGGVTRRAPQQRPLTRCLALGCGMQGAPMVGLVLGHSPPTSHHKSRCSPRNHCLKGKGEQARPRPGLTFRRTGRLSQGGLGDRRDPRGWKTAGRASQALPRTLPGVSREHRCWDPETKANAEGPLTPEGLWQSCSSMSP